MKILLLGATGATGKLLAEQLLRRNHKVKVVVRSADRLLESIRGNSNLEIIVANVAELHTELLAGIVQDCDAIASCLGHNITLKGVFGHPRYLVRDAVQLTCQAIRQNAPKEPVKFVLMNTVGNRNRDLDEPISLKDRVVIGLMRWLMPPQSDNEQAAEYLRTKVGRSDPFLEWVVVRPDTLINAGEDSEYEIFHSPTNSPVFGDRQTSRINVAVFMTELLTDPELWKKWEGQMPVVYNSP